MLIARPNILEKVPKTKPASEAMEWLAKAGYMNTEDFQRMYLGSWPKPSEEDIFLYSLAEEYHNRTKAYDHAICTGPIRHGSVLPSNNYEYSAINRKALAIKKELLDYAAKKGISSNKVLKAIQKFNANNMLQPTAR